MMVLEFCCQDESAFTALGKNCKEVKWRVAAMGTEPLEIKLTVEKLPKMSAEVAITCNGNKLYPLGSKGKEKLKNDFEHKWPFRGIAQGVHMKNFFEVRPKAMGAEWFPALSIGQRRDGMFEANVWFPDGMGGTKKVYMPAIEKGDIREQESKKPLSTPERFLVLNVPMSSPLKESSLSLMDSLSEDCITHFFARATPPSAGTALESLPAPNEIFMEVTKDRSKVITQVPHSTLTQYLTSEPRAISSTPESKTKMSWRFQIGPMAEHTVTVEKKYKSSKIVTLTVDGKVLVESAAADFDSEWSSQDDESASPSSTDEGGPWLCKFRFIGERSVKFKVFEQTSDGAALETTDLVEGLKKDQIKYTKVCTVSLKDQKDLRTALLEIDGVEFHALKQKTAIAEENIVCEPEVLQMQYGITTPAKVRDEPPTGLAAIHSKLKEAGQQWQEQLEKAGLQSLGSKMNETLGTMFKNG